ncbi:MAG TPA: FAD-binding oxidoreductase [Stellaceae bacterium]|jgi:D-amino-acid dehydrogenase|nr:FAD-binding oxidoreductase [Stellaceae bacterium]
MQADVMVLGAGMIGVSVAAHLQKRGKQVVLLDRRPPGEEASFGNAGLVQREAVFPYPFPRAFAELRRIARNRSVDAYYHLSALPGFIRPLLGYWRNSAPDRYATIARHYGSLIATCIDEHRKLAEEAGSIELLRPVGYIRAYEDTAALDADLAKAEAAKRDFGVNFIPLDPKALEEAEPHLRTGFAGGVHWTDPYAVNDPHALTLSYAALFERLGGTFVIGDAATLTRHGAGWRVSAGDGSTIEAAEAVVALGISSDRVTKRFGYAPPLFGKRGYHLHFKPKGNAGLTRPVGSNGFLLAPMRRGIRLTTGAEFARPSADPTPVQLRRAEAIARTLLPLEDAVEQTPWMGIRPCTPDMLPIIGPAPAQAHLWFAFGHAHQGFTLGPTTGRLLAEMMLGDTPFVDPAPFRAERFC